MSEMFERQTVSFVVRLWQEPTAVNPQWRMQIEHVASGETAHLQFSNALWAFLAQHLPIPGAPVVPENNPRVSPPEPVSESEGMPHA